MTGWYNSGFARDNDDVTIFWACATCGYETEGGMNPPSFECPVCAGKKVYNLVPFSVCNREGKRKMLIEYFSKWAEIGDSYIYDLTRVKEAFSIGTMKLDDFVEWDESRIVSLVDDFLDWLYSPAE